MWNLEKWFYKLIWKQKQTLGREQIYAYQGGKGRWEEFRDWHIYTIDNMYKIDN